jgi:ribosomal-protein-alanine N-acetyltransferase
MQLRPMSEADLAAILRLEKLSYPMPWPGWFFRRLLRGDSSCWVYEQNGVVVAYGIVRCMRDLAHLMNLCVAPGFRRRGLGRKMLLHLMQVARSRGARRTWLEVRPDNRVAIALYKSLGFSVRMRRKGYYRNAQQRQRDALVMSRTL